MTWILPYMFTVCCLARRYLVIFFCTVSFQGSFSYSKCACVTRTERTSGKAKKGTCVVDCGLNFVFFLSILALLPFLTALNDTPATIVTLRFVYRFYTTVTYCLANVQVTFTSINSCPNSLFLIHQFYSLNKGNHAREDVLSISI